MIEFFRLDCCPRCRRNLADDPEPGDDRKGCPVCRGRPIRCLAIWNIHVEQIRNTTDAPELRRAIRHEVVGAAALTAADVLQRTDGAAGEVLRLASSATTPAAPASSAAPTVTPAEKP